MSFDGTYSKNKNKFTNPNNEINLQFLNQAQVQNHNHNHNQAQNHNKAQKQFNSKVEIDEILENHLKVNEEITENILDENL